MDKIAVPMVVVVLLACSIGQLTTGPFGPNPLDPLYEQTQKEPSVNYPSGS